MRTRELNEIISLVGDKREIFLVGDEGSGKTYLLNVLNLKLKDSFYFDLVSLSKLIAFLNSKFRIKERNMVDSINKLNAKTKFRNETILLIDNYNVYDYKFKKYIKLLECKKIIASDKKERGFLYELKPISYDSSTEYISTKVEDPSLVRGIFNASSGNIKKMNLLIEEIRGKDRRDSIKVLRSQKPVINKEPILKIKNLFVIIYFLLFLRFVFYLNNNFREGFVLASVGYLLMIVAKLSGK